jgi:lipid II:glycine glycyltransferase (peptidoglycan interpeptide bridge formation enzyme)
MNLIVKDNLHSREWDDFAQKNARDGGFLQSWQWGEFQKSLGRIIYRLAVLDNKEIVAVVLAVRHKLPLGLNYIYLPRGPVVKANLGILYSQEQILKLIFQQIRLRAGPLTTVFLRLDPPFSSATDLHKLGCHPSGQVQPHQTLVLDLSASEDELLAKMKPKTRYNIKVATKHGVKISYSGKEDFEIFWQLMTKTAQRDRITSHPQYYYRKMLALPDARLVLAKYQDKVVAANLMIFFGDRCYYLHGASDYDYRDKMAPYLLQWQMILDAKYQGCRYYDFWGVDEKKWPGVTRFKIGFAPFAPLTEYIGAYDLIRNKFFYRLYQYFRNRK